MPRLYRHVAPTEPLTQGDIFHGVPMPDVSFAEPLHELIDENGAIRETEVNGDVRDKMNVVATIDLVDAIILDQSCDTMSFARVLLAPLSNVDLGSKPPKDQWDAIQKMGNSLHTPTRMYLADDETFGFPRRFIDLGAKFTLDREDLLRFAEKGKRVATLTPPVLAYLQNRLAIAFSRVARDDIDWMSPADLELKIAVLQTEVNKKQQTIQQKKTELAKATDDGVKEEIEETIRRHQGIIQDWIYEIDVAKKALSTISQPG